MPSRRLSLTPIDLFILLFALSAILGVWPAYDPNLSLGVLAAMATFLEVAMPLGIAPVVSSRKIALGPDRLPFLSSTFSRASDRGQLSQNSLC